MNIGPYIEERVVTKFSTEVKLKVDIVADATKHADERKFRHDKEITDSEIRSSVFKATERVMQDHIDGKIKDNEKFLIYDPSNNHLNIVATFHMNQKGTPEKITIVTVMREKNFNPNEIKKKYKV